MNKNNAILIFLCINAVYILFTGVCISEDSLLTPSENADPDWIFATKKQPEGYNLSQYQPDDGMSFSLDGESFQLEPPAVRRETEIWVPVNALLKNLGLLFIKLDDKSVNIIGFDGSLFSLSLGSREVVLNKRTSFKIRKPLAKYRDYFMLELESLSRSLGIECTYDAQINSVQFEKEKQEGFSTFTMVKPIEVIQEEAAEEEMIEELKPRLPREIKEEILHGQYAPDIDLLFDDSFSYFHDMLDNYRIRYNELYLSGRAYGVSVKGQLTAKDFRSNNKIRFREEGQHLSFFKDGDGIRLFDNYVTLSSVRTQAQSYWGLEATNKHLPFMKKSVVKIGRLDPVSVTSLDGGQSIRYFGDLYFLEQDWIDDEKAEVSTMVMVVRNDTELGDDKGDSTHPRDTLVYLVDSELEIKPDLKFYNTFAQSVYVRDDKPKTVISDIDYRTRFRLKKKRYILSTGFEYVGDEYASLSLPSTYQDYMGWDFSSSFYISDIWSFGVTGSLNKDNVDRIGPVQTTYGRTLSVTNSFNLPWGHDVNLSWYYNRTHTEGTTWVQLVYINISRIYADRI